jgi:hypothetical protein
VLSLADHDQRRAAPARVRLSAQHAKPSGCSAMNRAYSPALIAGALAGSSGLLVFLILRALWKGTPAAPGLRIHQDLGRGYNSPYPT